MLAEVNRKAEELVKELFPLAMKNRRYFADMPDDPYSCWADFWHKDIRIEYRTNGEKEEFQETMKIYDDYNRLMKKLVFAKANLFSLSRHPYVDEYEEYDKNGCPDGIWKKYDQVENMWIVTDYRKGIKNRIGYTYYIGSLYRIIHYEDGFPISVFFYEDGRLVEERFFTEEKITRKNLFSLEGSIQKIVIYDESKQEKSVQYFDKGGFAIGVEIKK